MQIKRSEWYALTVETTQKARKKEGLSSRLFIGGQVLYYNLIFLSLPYLLIICVKIFIHRTLS